MTGFLNGHFVKSKLSETSSVIHKFSLVTSIFVEQLLSREMGFLFEFRNLNRFFNSEAYKLFHEGLKWDFILYKLSV